MGRFSDQAIKRMESLSTATPTKFICANHFNDGSINYFIRKNYNQGHCDYCRGNRKVVPLRQLVDFLIVKILNFYEDAVNILGYDSRQGGYLGSTITTDELIQEWIELTAEPFYVIEDIYVIDFQKLPKLPSIFGVKNKARFHLKEFLHYFVQEISKEIKKDGKEHIDYVPTQVVTEFLRYPYNRWRKNKISGLIYPSSKNNAQASAVFFWDKELSKKKVKLIDLNTQKLEPVPHVESSIDLD